MGANALAAAPESAPNLAVAVGSESEQEHSPLQKLGLNFTLLYLFFRFSFLHEFISDKLHADTHIIIVLGVLAYAGALLSGRIMAGFRYRSTWLWIGFAVCMCGATITSFWPGGSLPLALTYLKTALPIVLVIPAVVTSRKDVVKIVNVIGVACIVTVFMGAVNDDFKSGRMSIDAAGSDIQDPNDYAAHLILMLPAMAYLTMRQGRNIVWKLLGVGVLALSLFQILSTGSRGGVVSLAITAAYIALISSARVRAAILVGIPVLGLAAVPFLPQESAARLSTLFTSSSSKAAEAQESSEARLMLLQASWKATLQHPLFGVGPGIFMDYQASAAKENGQRGMWHVTHNSYTQVSSECGIPALLFYAGAIGATFWMLRKSVRAKDSVLSPIAQVMTVMLVGFCVCIFFLSMAYTVQILAVSALAAGIRTILADSSSIAERSLPTESLAHV